MHPQKGQRFLGSAGTALLLLVSGFSSAAQDVGHHAKPPQSASEESATAKIRRALAAGPSSITNNATVAEIDPEGGMTVLRRGTNDFTCMPGDPDGVGKPALCADKVAMQWNSDFEQHKARPSTTVPGIEYMLAGQRSAATPIRSIRPARRFRSDHTG